MKNEINGFTLAEVLITLAIIGVIAAIILPSVMANYQYKAVGVKLAKFVSTTEAAARAFVVNNDNFSTSGSSRTDIQTFINDSFLFKTVYNSSGAASTSTDTSKNYVLGLSSSTLPNKYISQSTSNKAILKDGTSIIVYTATSTFNTSTRGDIVNSAKYGAPAFTIGFAPNIQGIPSTVHKVFYFTVTELGYVVPSANDTCTWDLYNKDFNTTARMFASGTSCYDTTASGPPDNSIPNGPPGSS